MGDQNKDVDRVSQIAEEQMAKFAEEDKAKAEAEKSKQEESKGASAESSTEKEKTKEESKQAEDEKQKAASEQDDKSKEVKEEDKSKEDRIKDKVDKRKDELQKEIDALIAKRESLKTDVGELDKANDKIKDLEGRLNKLEQPGKEQETRDAVANRYDKKLKAYLEEDKDKPFEERREMTDEDLEEFLLENNVRAVQWISKRDIRRDKELAVIEAEVAKSGNDGQQAAKDFLAKQEESRKKLYGAYPGLDISVRGKQLIAEGKTKEEALKILREENKEFSLMLDIVAEDEKKYQNSVNGPELVLEEMNKRLGKKADDGKKTFTAEEVEQRVKEAQEMERKRLSGIDEGAGASTRSGQQQSASNGTKPNGYSEEGRDAFIKAGKMSGETWTEKDYIETLERRNAIPGVNIRDVVKK